MKNSRIDHVLRKISLLRHFAKNLLRNIRIHESLLDVNESTMINEETNKYVLGGIQTRVVEERVVNAQTGELREIAINYFAMCRPTNSVYYFGENTTDFKNGKVVGHEGSWQQGLGNAHAGLVMLGIILLGSKYYQEVAPEVALDRVEIVSVNGTAKTPAGNFGNCLEVKDTSPLEPSVIEYKFYAPGVGLVDDNGLHLVKYGYIKVT
jgi:hypothetical protein